MDRKSRSPSPKQTNSSKNKSLHCSFSPFNLSQILENRVQLLDQFVDQTKQIAGIIADEINQILDKIEHHLSLLNIDSKNISGQIDNLQLELEQVINKIVDLKNENENLLILFNQFETGLDKWNLWYQTSLNKIKCFHSKIILVGSNELNVLSSTESNLSGDISYKLENVVHFYQVSFFYKFFLIFYFMFKHYI